MRWNLIEKVLPNTGQFVFLIKDKRDNFSNVDIGRLIIQDDRQLASWFCSNDGMLRKLTARPYWLFLQEKDLAIPDIADDQLLPYVSYFLKKLALYEKKFKRLALITISSGKGVYPVDYMLSGVLNRSLSIIYGFETLLKSANFLAAAHLARPMLDNYLRFSAVWLVEKPHEFVKEVWSGKAVNKIKDRDGNAMHDSYLRDKAAAHYPWIANVYNETSGFIHFSSKHIHHATTLSDLKERTLETVISKFDHKVSNESKLEAIICMIEICNSICDAACGWLDTKRMDMMKN